MKRPLYETEILIDICRGIVLVTTWYDDGSVEERRVPKYPPILIKPLGLW